MRISDFVLLWACFWNIWLSQLGLKVKWLAFCSCIRLIVKCWEFVRSGAWAAVGQQLRVSGWTVSEGGGMNLSKHGPDEGYSLRAAGFVNKGLAKY